MKTIHVAAAILIRDDRVFAAQRGYGDFKDYWEFPGGKIENGETPRQALYREIKEELGAEFRVGDLFASVEYDYPEFHLSMDCFLCEVASGEIELLEHEAARWLAANELNSVGWLPADFEVVEKLKARLI